MHRAKTGGLRGDLDSCGRNKDDSRGGTRFECGLGCDRFAKLAGTRISSSLKAGHRGAPLSTTENAREPRSDPCFWVNCWACLLLPCELLLLLLLRAGKRIRALAGASGFSAGLGALLLQPCSGSSPLCLVTFAAADTAGGSEQQRRAHCLQSPWPAECSQRPELCFAAGCVLSDSSGRLATRLFSPCATAAGWCPLLAGCPAWADALGNGSRLQASLAAEQAASPGPPPVRWKPTGRKATLSWAALRCLARNAPR